MGKKAIFLDVDGTLCTEKGGVPETAVYAIKKARENGHKVFLCTGRCRSELYDFILDIGFDGIIGSSGGYIELDNKIIFHKVFENDDLIDIVDFFEEHHIDFFLESNHGLYASAGCPAHLERVMGVENAHKDPFMASLTLGKVMRDLKEVNKICFMDSDMSISTIKQRYGNKFTIVQCTVPMFGKESGEVVLNGIHKASAIEMVLEQLGIDINDTLAIGDGMNDAEMLYFVHIGIAMGNAHANLKKLADDITDDVDNDGILHSFEKYGLIS